MTPRPTILAIAVLAAGLATAAPAAADVSVKVAPRGEPSSLVFRDAKERDILLREMARQLVSLGEKSLPKGASLDVALLDIRPAGRLDPFTGPSQIRVLSGATPPSVTLRYALKERGRTVAAGEETVTDLNYLEDISARTSLSSFPYERELIRDWFRKRIVRREPVR